MFVLLSSTQIVFFIAVVHVVSLLWQLLSFNIFIMGKVKVGLYFYLTLGILTKLYSNVP